MIDKLLQYGTALALLVAGNMWNKYAIDHNWYLEFVIGNLLVMAAGIVLWDRD